MTGILRVAAIAIALAALIDPVVAITGATRAHVAVVIDDPQSAAAARIRERLTRDLNREYDVVPEIASDTDAAVVIGDRYPDVASSFSPTYSGLVSTVTIPTPTVAIAHVAAPREVPPATTIRIEATVDARGAAGQSTDLVARIDGVELGRASHRWTGDGERWTAALDIAPFGEPPFLIRVQAGASAADVAVARRVRPIRVQAYDARPSWASTFTRRALESDPRFQVDGIVVSSRGIAVRTAGAVPLADPRLDEFDALLVGAVDVLSVADARALDRYMRVRGGAVILLPDQRVLSAAALDLISGGGVAPARFSERLLDRPSTLTAAQTAATLQTSEMLLLEHVGAGVDVLASTPGSAAVPVVASIPRGAGRLLLSGAMDAWRFRAAADRGFDRFWQAAIAGLALATPPVVDVSVTPQVLRPNEAGEVVVRARSATAAARASASIDDHPIRLWPDAEAGVYRGTFVAAAAERRSVVRAVGSDAIDRTATAVVPVRTGVHHAADAGVAPLAMLASSHRGINVDADHVADLVRFVRDAVKSPRTTVPAHPMRSPWWIAAFGGCLGGEWWLRRRRGLR
jgi:hypothetical protein